MGSIAKHKMSCEAALEVIRKINSLHKTTPPENRSSVEDAFSAIAHLRRCGACKSTFLAEICQGGFISWVPKYPHNDRSLMHCFMHQSARIPHCVQDAELVNDLEARLAKTTFEAKTSVPSVEFEQDTFDVSTHILRSEN